MTIALNKVIDLSIEDSGEQSPMMSALRQTVPEFSSIILTAIERSRKVDNVRPATWRVPDLNKPSSKHGYPLHVAVLSHKFDIAFRMLRLGKHVVNPSSLTSIGANIIHLLLVKYEKDPEWAFKILKLCV